MAWSVKLLENLQWMESSNLRVESVSPVPVMSGHINGASGFWLLMLGPVARLEWGSILPMVELQGFVMINVPCPTE